MTPASQPTPLRDFTARVAIVLGLVALVWTLHVGSLVLLLFFAGLLLAVLLRAPADALAERVSWLNGGVAFGICALLFGGFFVGFVALAGPGLGAQVDQLTEELPGALEGPLAKVETLPGGSWLVEQVRGFERNDGGGSGLLSRVTGIASNVFGVLTEMVVVIFVGLFLGAEPRLYRAGALHLVPVRHRDRARELLTKLGSTLRWWLVGRLSSMLIIVVAVYLVLLVLDIQLAFGLAVLAGILTFIPNFGPFLAALPAVLLGLAQSPKKALLVAASYAGIQAVESYLLTPMIQKRAVELPPALILLSQVFFGVLFGFWGLVLATPLTAVILVLVRELYVRDVLGDDAWE